MKTWKMAGAIATALAAMALTAGAAQANLVLNGDFSANASSYVTYPGYSIPTQSPANPTNPTSWVATNQVGVNGPDTGFYASLPFAPGNTTGVRDFAFLQNASLNAPASIEQTIATVSGQLYSLTYAAAQRNGNSGATMKVLVHDAANGNSTITFQNPGINSGSFGDFALTFTAQSASTVIEFLNTTDINCTYSDNTVDVSNVVLNAVPQPATVGLLGFGSLALIGGLALRRRTATKL